jgi:hypothetical protein
LTQISKNLCDGLGGLCVLCGSKNAESVNAKPGAGDSAVAAGGAAAWRMRCDALEHEIACLATRWSEYQAQPARANAALDVSEIFLEHFDSQAKFSAEVVELPL